MAAENMEKYKTDWDDAKARIRAWWERSSIGRPMMHLYGIREKALETAVKVPEPQDDRDRYLNVRRLMDIARNQLREMIPLAESFPQVDFNIGPGSMAIYLGSEPVFYPDTVWFQEVIGDWNEFGRLRFDPENIWLKQHLAMFEEAVELADGELLVNIPDIIEGVDILSALRGSNAFCYDLIDEPELMHKYLCQLDEFYFCYYDLFYDLVKADDGSSSFTAFKIWGPGKTVKVQCDFSALMNPSQFREFVQPYLRRQCAAAGNTLYHLDGPDAICHLPALMEIAELDALQWTAGAGNLSAADESWYPIFDQARDAGKSLWISVDEYRNTEEAAAIGKRLTRRYGSDGLYLLFPTPLPEKEARSLICQAEKW